VLTSDPSGFSLTVYYVNSRTPRLPVNYEGWFSDVRGGGHKLVNHRIAGVGGRVSVPVPRGAVASGGYDGNIAIINYQTGEEWDMHRFAHSSGGYTAGNVGHYNLAWSGSPPYDDSGKPWQLRGSGVPYLAGLVRPCEVAQGRINHAVALGIPAPASRHVYPATKSDGHASYGLAEGAHLQLDPTIPDSTIRGTWHCNGACYVIAKALQTYGMYVTDTSGRIKIPVEDAATASWHGKITASTVSPIPVNDLRLLAGR
jgi:hypothetical protein